MTIPSITILGGDLRQCYAAEYLCMQGWHVTCYHTAVFPYDASIHTTDSLTDAFDHSDYILPPTPLSKNHIHLFQPSSYTEALPLCEIFNKPKPGQTWITSGLPPQQEQLLLEKNCRILKLSDSPDFTADNALLTAEGLLAEIIRYTPFSLADSNILLFGYGSCGSAISRLLLPLCRRLFVLETDKAKQAYAAKAGICPLEYEALSTVLPKCRILINTVPAPVLDSEEASVPPAFFQEDFTSLLSGDCHIFDIASKPTLLDICRKRDTGSHFSHTARKTTDSHTLNWMVPYVPLPGLPGRFAPMTAGYIIGKTIERMLAYDL